MSNINLLAWMILNAVATVYAVSFLVDRICRPIVAAWAHDTVESQRLLEAVDRIAPPTMGILGRGFNSAALMLALPRISPRRDVSLNGVAIIAVGTATLGAILLLAPLFGAASAQFSLKPETIIKVSIGADQGAPSRKAVPPLTPSTPTPVVGPIPPIARALGEAYTWPTLPMEISDDSKLVTVALPPDQNLVPQGAERVAVLVDDQGRKLSSSVYSQERPIPFGLDEPPLLGTEFRPFALIVYRPGASVAAAALGVGASAPMDGDERIFILIEGPASEPGAIR